MGYLENSEKPDVYERRWQRYKYLFDDGDSQPGYDPSTAKGLEAYLDNPVPKVKSQEMEELRTRLERQLRSRIPKRLRKKYSITTPKEGLHGQETYFSHDPPHAIGDSGWGWK